MTDSLQNCIEKLLLLGQDTLLMGTNEGLCLYDMMREKFTTIVPQTKAPLYVLDMAYDGRSVFIASDSGLYAYSKTEQSMPLLHKGLIVKVNAGYEWKCMGSESKYDLLFPPKRTNDQKNHSY